METVMIFGASGGIGASLAKKLSDEGKRVVLCSRNQKRLELLAQDLKQPYLICDGCSPKEVKEAVERVTQDYGRIDGVVNCIGSFFIKPLSMTSLDDWNEVMRVNVTSCFCIVQASLQVMLAQGAGSIVLISSCAAQIGLVNHEAIGAAKGAVEGLVRAAAASGAVKGVRVNGVAPGLTNTPLAKDITSKEHLLKASVAFHPMGRIGEPADISSPIAWLLSKDSAWVTGEVISVDGGLSHLKLRS